MIAAPVLGGAISNQSAQTHFSIAIGLSHSARFSGKFLILTPLRRHKSQERTCFVQLGGSFEEAWQRRLQHHHKVLQLLRYSNQHVFIHQVVFGLLQSPLAAHVPAQRSCCQCVVRSRRIPLITPDEKRSESQQKWGGGRGDTGTAEEG